MSEPRSTRSEFLGASFAGSIVVAFCFLLLWHDPLLFWNDDYQLSILPVFADVARSWSEGHLPLLSPYSWVCSNLAGEFQYGTFSVFVNAAVVLIWKFPLDFPQQAAALSITHLFVLAAGAFLLARDRKLSVSLSIFVALVATLNGWIICWGATDWFGALGAFAWLPWTWWGLERALDPQRSRFRSLWPAPFVYLVVTGGFPYTVVMLGLLVGWLASRSLVQTRSLSSILPMLVGVALGFGLSAPAWLAILDYVRGSARELQPSSAHWQWIVPPSALPGLILPCWTVNWADFSTRMTPHSATELACGLVPIPALIAALIGRGRTFVKQFKWEFILLVVVLMLAMLPTADVFRWSFRWLPFFHLLLALCAAEALRMLSGEKNFTAKDAENAEFQNKTSAPSAFSAVKNPGLIGFGVVALVATATSILHVSGPFAFPLTWIFLALTAIWALSEFGRNAALRRPGQRSALSLPREWIPVCVASAAFLATYLCIPPNCGVPKYNLSQELLKAAPLDPQRLYLSFYPTPEVSYRIETQPAPIGQVVRPGSMSMWGRLRFINGYSPILAAGVAREFKFAIHGEIDWTVGMHLLEEVARGEGDLESIGVDGIIIAPEMLSAADAIRLVGLQHNRGYSTSEDSLLPRSEWREVFSSNEGRVFHRMSDPFPSVRATSAISTRANERFAVPWLRNINDSRNRVDVDVDVPNSEHTALLVFSRPFFRGYEARLNEKKLAVSSYRGLFPIVEVPAGSRGRLSLVYRPAWLLYGGVVAIGSAAIWIIGMIFALRPTTSKR